MSGSDEARRVRVGDVEELRAGRRTGLLGAPDAAAEQVSQLRTGERVIVRERVAGWARVVVPGQPSSRDPEGYPGWVRLADLAAEPLDVARLLAGTPYLWGGTGPGGIDCSGLVHSAYAAFDVVVPRDAHDQAAAASAVARGRERAGDLYFFAHDRRPVHHVGFVAAPGVMLHAPDAGPRRYVVEEELPPERAATLVAVGRFALPR